LVQATGRELDYRAPEELRVGFPYVIPISPYPKLIEKLTNSLDFMAALLLFKLQKAIVSKATSFCRRLDT
jgi:hypothetical protein